MSGAVPALRWEGPAGRRWDGYSGEELVAFMVEPCAGYRFRWYLRVDDGTKPFVESSMDESEARADVQAAWAAWCERAGLVAAARAAGRRGQGVPDMPRGGDAGGRGAGVAAGVGVGTPGGGTGFHRTENGGGA